MGGLITKQQFDSEEKSLLGNDNPSFYWGATAGWMAYVGATETEDFFEDELDGFRRRRESTPVYNRQKETIVSVVSNKLSEDNHFEKVENEEDALELGSQHNGKPGYLEGEEEKGQSSEELIDEDFDEEKPDLLLEEEKLLRQQEEELRQQEAKLLEEQRKLEEKKRRKLEEERRRQEEEQERIRQQEERKRILEEKRRKQKEEEEARIKELKQKEVENELLKKQVEDMQRRLQEETKLRLKQKEQFNEEMEENKMKMEALKSLKESASQMMQSQFEAITKQTEMALSVLNHSKQKLENLLEDVEDQMSVSQKTGENLERIKNQLISDVNLKANFEKANEMMSQDLSSLDDGINEIIKARGVFESWQKQLEESKSKFDEEIASLQDHAGSSNLKEVIVQMEKSKQEVQDEISQLTKRIEISDSRKKKLEEMKQKCNDELKKCQQAMSQMNVAETQENFLMLQDLLKEVTLITEELENYKNLLGDNLNEVDLSLSNTKDLQSEIFLHKFQHENDCLNELEESFERDVDNIETSLAEEMDQIITNQRAFVDQKINEIKSTYQPKYDLKKEQQVLEKTKEVENRIEELSIQTKKAEEFLERSEKYIQQESDVLDDLADSHQKVKDDMKAMSGILAEETKEREEFTKSKSTGIQYQAKKGDLVDKMVSDFLNSITGIDQESIPYNFERISEGVYQFGTKKIRAQILNGSLVVRVGGGFMTFPEFVKKYGKSESVKIMKAPGGPRTTALVRKGMMLSLANFEGESKKKPHKSPSMMPSTKTRASRTPSSTNQKAIKNNRSVSSPVVSPVEKSPSVKRAAFQTNEKLKKTPSKEKPFRP